MHVFCIFGFAVHLIVVHKEQTSHTRGNDVSFFEYLKNNFEKKEGKKKRRKISHLKKLGSSNI